MTGPSLRHALFCQRVGLAVLWKRSATGGPVKGRGKSPVMMAWNAQPCQSAEQLRRVFREGYNLGIHCGAVTGCPVPIVVADSDSPESELWAQRFLPMTPLVVSSAKGLHRYYRHPGPGHFVPTRQKIKEAGGLDVIADNGQITIPPSIHPSGTQYRWLNQNFFASLSDAEALIDSLPIWDDARIPKRQYEAKPSPVRLHFAGRNQAGDQARAAAWLRKRDPAVSGQAGHSWTFKTALQLLQRFELSEDVAFELLQVWNESCAPPWSEYELRRKVHEAAKARLQLGRLQPSRSVGNGQ